MDRGLPSALLPAAEARVTSSTVAGVSSGGLRARTGDMTHLATPITLRAAVRGAVEGGVVASARGGVLGAFTRLTRDQRQGTRRGKGGYRERTI